MTIIKSKHFWLTRFDADNEPVMNFNMRLSATENDGCFQSKLEYKVGKKYLDPRAGVYIDGYGIVKNITHESPLEAIMRFKKIDELVDEAMMTHPKKYHKTL